MSCRTTLKYLSTVALSAVVIGFIFKSTASMQSSTHASLGDGTLKNVSLKPYNETLRRTHKLRPPIEVQLRNPAGEQPLGLDEDFTLEGSFETSRDLATVHYAWVLPGGSVIARGILLSGVLNDVRVGNTYTLTGHFTNASVENSKIHLRIWIPGSNEKMIQTAQYNTQEQEKIVLGKKELLERQAEYMTSHPDRLRKFK